MAAVALALKVEKYGQMLPKGHLFFIMEYRLQVPADSSTAKFSYRASHPADFSYYTTSPERIAV
jgi:hypothetical protein